MLSGSWSTAHIPPWIKMQFRVFLPLRAGANTDASALYPCQPDGKNTRSRAPAQHCTHASQMARTPARAPAQYCAHASQMVRTPAHAHPLSTAHMPAKWQEHPLTRTRWALYPCQPDCSEAAGFPVELQTLDAQSPSEFLIACRLCRDKERSRCLI